MSEAEKITVNCGEVLDISRVSELYAELDVVLNENSLIEMDVSKIERIDVAGIQLLISFRNQVKSSGHDVNWIAPSENFLRSVSLVGLDGQLGLLE